jgi:hypothetical protein
MFRVVLVFSFILASIFIIRQYLQEKRNTHPLSRYFFREMIGMLLLGLLSFVVLFFIVSPVIQQPFIQIIMSAGLLILDIPYLLIVFRKHM